MYAVHYVCYYLNFKHVFTKCHLIRWRLKSNSHEKFKKSIKFPKKRSSRSFQLESPKWKLDIHTYQLMFSLEFNGGF